MSILGVPGRMVTGKTSGSLVPVLSVKDIQDHHLEVRLSMLIDFMLRTVPGRQHHQLDFQETILKIFFKQSIIKFEIVTAWICCREVHSHHWQAGQCLEDSTIWTHKRVFCTKVYWNKVILKFERQPGSFIRGKATNGSCWVYLTNEKPCQHIQI